MLTSLRRWVLPLAALLIVAGFVVLFLTPNEQHTPQPPAAIASTQAIDELTKEDRVVMYLKKFQRLPDYYITKREAKRLGWTTHIGNLCKVAPNKAIGGDRFMNREGQLPQALKRVWFEADLDYHCGFRGENRVLFSNDGLIYITRDHYQTFKQVAR